MTYASGHWRLTARWLRRRQDRALDWGKLWVSINGRLNGADYGQKIKGALGRGKEIKSCVEGNDEKSTTIDKFIWILALNIPVLRQEKPFKLVW